MVGIQRSLYRTIHYIIQKEGLTPDDDFKVSLLIEDALDGVYGTTVQSVTEHTTKEWKQKFVPPTWDQIIQMLQIVVPLIILFLELQHQTGDGAC